MLFLVHHGDAVEADVDPRRPLSKIGRETVDRLAHQAAARGVSPAVIGHSGKLRARQTAEMFWRACNPLADFVAMRGLQPGDPADWIVDRIMLEEADLMLVGHLPNLPSILVSLTGDKSASGRFPLNGVIALVRGETGWCEAWRLTAF